jgi:glycosyltransferase involved in cell wall biosynthesis
LCPYYGKLDYEMRVTVALEQRFARYGEAVFAESAAGNSFWQRYLDVFDEVTVFARVMRIEHAPDGWLRVDGDGVNVYCLPHYVGPEEYVRNWWKLRRSTRSMLTRQSAYILRAPGTISDLLWGELSRNCYPYGMEVVADPFDVFSAGAVKHPLRRLFRLRFTHRLRYQCARAVAVAYVTQSALQHRYPPGARTYSTYYSDVVLSDRAFASGPRAVHARGLSYSIITVGMLDQLYKSQDVLIDAVAICINLGWDVRLLIVGDGKYRRELEMRAAARGIASKVGFAGLLSDPGAVRERLMQADLFALPSRQEGLPRAMVEAMAQGLPCIGSTVGGIPELLVLDDMVPPDDANLLALKILEVLSDPIRMARMSSRNLEKAKEYHENALRKRRIEFYQSVRDQTHWPIQRAANV